MDYKIFEIERIDKYDTTRVIKQYVVKKRVFGFLYMKCEVYNDNSPYIAYTIAGVLFMITLPFMFFHSYNVVLFMSNIISVCVAIVSTIVYGISTTEFSSLENAEKFIKERVKEKSISLKKPLEISSFKIKDGEMVLERKIEKE